MSITNEDRYNLQERANELLGKKEGTTLMELLPPVGWADVATKNDLDVQTALLDAKLSLLRSDLDTQLSGLRSDLESKTSGLRSDLEHKTSGLRSDFQAELESGLRRLESRMFTAFLTLIGVLATMAGLLVAVLLRA
ncbi:MAG: hypothetical protein WBB59_13660 [Candidatus Microthrix parvicella]|uniref:DUF1640 domain-containing protein n=1 Tax=Candidatus Neomicrothrix parvicella RN1 TaxID=1229780 RepID=R4Z6V0_9ACTN|nr:MULTISPECIES: hypothetical protein [Microthrix]MBK7021703.1 hypothetical protein [Candidatus Microthrix sp.]MBK7321847.1 hypothetical protein [Candidatus Microthrix sp.]MBP6151763.1 hypothetical protein [Candidatus Microthrix sp.]MBP7596280.1 hypothetical protein [Candidatus Microthrix sp.]MBP7996436.1 hypothetical protein [Candidatus Microthrix sp.]